MKVSDLMKVKQLTFNIKNNDTVRNNDLTFFQFQISFEEFEEQQKIEDLVFSFTLTVCLSQIKIEDITLLCINSLDKETC